MTRILWMRISSAVPGGTSILLPLYPAVPAGLFSNAPGGAWIVPVEAIFKRPDGAWIGVPVEVIFRRGKGAWVYLMFLLGLFTDAANGA